MVRPDRSTRARSRNSRDHALPPQQQHHQLINKDGQVYFKTSSDPYRTPTPHRREDMSYLDTGASILDWFPHR